MNINKSTYLQDYLIVAGVVAIVVSGLLSHTALPLVSILGGFLAGLIIPRFIYSKKWNNKEFNKLPSWKRYLIAAIPAAVGCQMGWAALLI